MIFQKIDTQYGLMRRDVEQVCADTLESRQLDNKRVLVVIPDHSRTAPIDMMFDVLYTLLAERADTLDFLIALGTHPPMSESAIYQRVGITAELHRNMYSKARFFNHHWDDPEKLVKVGTIEADEIAAISGGLLQETVDVTINKMVFDYDVIMIVGPVFPHEVVGFSGGNKYLFPGIAGQDIIDLFHWLGALITNQKIIGIQETPVRKVIDMAASFLPIERMCFSLVVNKSRLDGIFISTPEESQSAAAALSEQLHIVYKQHAYNSVLSCAPVMYDDIWTAGKCMYKLEPVVAAGGELIIYAPHIRQVSETHGRIIESIGYHVRDYFLKQMDRFAHVPGGVMAHSTHVRGIGTFEDGVERPRIQVTLATQIPENVCAKINLGYRDPETIVPSEWAGREDEGVLYVEKAGEILYRLKESS
ncbi:MAG: lactate racemase domain-containing protein [candidate division KSB1 bacterium]|nr:lactate racemase domain-containing protein [candidate division KSB1 bacterium]